MAREHSRAAVQRLPTGVALAAALLAGCLAAPRGGQELSHADEPLVLEGVVERADQAVTVEGFDHAARRWTPIGTVEPSELVRTTSPLGVGQRFRTELVLPQLASYFVPGRTPQSLQARVRARQGTRFLASFDAAGERCLRALADSQASALRADSVALVRAGLSRCAARGSPAVEVTVPHCGEDGQSCCARFGGSEDALCRADLSCEAVTSSALAQVDAIGATPAGAARRCVRPAYSVPWLHDRVEDLAVSASARVREAWLELDDTSVGAPSRVVLVSKREPAPFVSLERPQRDALRLRFDVPLVRPGRNRFRVFALIETERGVVDQSTPWQSVEYTPEPRLGHLGPGRFQLPARHFPMWMRDCRGAACIDRDGDGLSDAWENVALQQLRPRLLLDADDRVFDGGDPVRLLSSIVPLRRDGRDHVLFAHVVTFVRDFGPPGLPRLVAHGHAGDTEAFGMAFEVQPDGALKWVASVAKGHTCLTCKSSWHWHGQDFDTDGVPLLTVEEDKHGLWQRRSACQAEAGFDCEADRALRPVAINAGDAHVGGAAALVDVFDDVDPKGPHAELAGAYPGEALWSSGRARLPGRFCGGKKKGCTKLRSARLPGDVLGSVVKRLSLGTW